MKRNRRFLEKTPNLFFVKRKQEICRENSRFVFYLKENKRFEKKKKRTIDS